MKELQKEIREEDKVRIRKELVQIDRGKMG